MNASKMPRPSENDFVAKSQNIHYRYREILMQAAAIFVLFIVIALAFVAIHYRYNRHHGSIINLHAIYLLFQQQVQIFDFILGPLTFAINFY